MLHFDQGEGHNCCEGVGVFMYYLCGSTLKPLEANPQLASVEGTRITMAFEAPIPMRAEGFAYDHEVTVVLPASYDVSPNKTYPVLWVTNAPLMLRTVVGLQDTLVMGNLAPEMIVIGAGSRSDEGFAGLGRRVIDFSPPGDGYHPPSLAGDIRDSLAPLPDFPHMADAFAGFLVDQARPTLAQTYRFSGEHALLGFSAGWMFAAYTLFARPGDFNKYIIGSPYLDGVQGAVFAAEADYATAHGDLEAAVFLGAGEAEVSDDFLVISGITSSMLNLSRVLRVRNYPSLEIGTRIFPGEDHYTVVHHVISAGIRTLWADDVKGLPSTWPQRP